MTCNTSAVAVCCSKIAPARVHFGDQPRILDRDHRLRREILQQRDLLVGERPYLLAVDREETDCGIILDHRHHQHRADTAELDCCDR